MTGPTGGRAAFGCVALILAVCFALIPLVMKLDPNHVGLATAIMLAPIFGGVTLLFVFLQVRRKGLNVVKAPAAQAKVRDGKNT